jgi:hypothetical protein
MVRRVGQPNLRRADIAPYLPVASQRATGHAMMLIRGAHEAS